MFYHLATTIRFRRQGSKVEKIKAHVWTHANGRETYQRADLHPAPVKPGQYHRGRRYEGCFLVSPDKIRRSL